MNFKGQINYSVENWPPEFALRLVPSYLYRGEIAKFKGKDAAFCQ